MQASPLARRARRGLSFDTLYMLIGLSLIALKVLLTPVPPFDFWWHMALGRQIVEQGGIPTLDSFSYTQPGAPFFNQGWLAQLLMYGLHQLGGMPLIIAVQAAVIAAAYWMLLALVSRRSGRPRLAVVVLLLCTVPLSFDNWMVRPQSYALPIFAAFLLVLTAYRLRWWRRLWLLPPLMLLWANIHGSFVLGLGLIGLIWLAELVRRLRGVEQALSWDELRTLALYGVATALALLVNPQGFGLIGYVRNLLGSSQVTTLVSEWASPSLSRPADLPFFLYLALCALVLALTRYRPPLSDVLLALAFGWLAFSAVRNIFWFALVTLPPLADALAGRIRPARQAAGRGSPAMNGLLAGFMALLLLLASPWLKPSLGLPPQLGQLVSPDTPVVAVERLRALPAEQRPRRLYHLEGVGSYLIWAAPEQPVFIDPRIELYPYQQWLDSLALGNGQRLDELLARYDIDGVLLLRDRQETLAEQLRQRAGWQLVFEDERSMLFVRS